MSSTTVIMKRLESEHNPDTFTVFRPLGEGIKAKMNVVIEEIFDTLGGKSLLKSSGDVYVKPNAVDSRPYTHTRPEVVEAVIRYWFEAGARNVCLIENSTQCTYTRLVFKLTGYKSMLKSCPRS